MIEVLNLEQMRADSKILDSVSPEVRGHRIEEMHFCFAEDEELLFRQAALDAIEITELKRELQDTQDQLQIHQDHEQMEALASCGLCTCMEPLVDGRCEMCDPPMYDDEDRDPTYYNDGDDDITLWEDL